MRIVCISDTHCQLESIRIPLGDVLVHAGDLTYTGSEKELRPQLQILSGLPGFKKKILIAGNHDWLFATSPAYARMLLKLYNVTYLEDEEAVVDGVHFYGSPWQPEFGGWAFNLPRETTELAERWEAIPDHTDVLITHGPPLKIADLTPRGENVGCYDLRQRVLDLSTKQLKAHIFGHIHHSYGLLKNFPGMETTTFVNASCCNERYDPKNKPIVIDI